MRPSMLTQLTGKNVRYHDEDENVQQVHNGCTSANSMYKQRPVHKHSWSSAVLYNLKRGHALPSSSVGPPVHTRMSGTDFQSGVDSPVYIRDDNQQLQGEQHISPGHDESMHFEEDNGRGAGQRRVVCRTMSTPVHTKEYDVCDITANAIQFRTAPLHTAKRQTIKPKPQRRRASRYGDSNIGHPAASVRIADAAKWFDSPTPIVVNK
eukprot:Lankesteria_metandrocarpae@DN2286_c0_g1_i1.p1